MFFIKAVGLGFLFLSLCLFTMCYYYCSLSRKYQVQVERKTPKVAQPVTQDDIVRKKGAIGSRRTVPKRRAIHDEEEGVQLADKRGENIVF